MRRLLVVCALAVSAPAATSAQPASISRGPIVVASPDGQLIATIAPADAAATANRWRYRLDRSVDGARVEVLGWSPSGARLILDVRVANDSFAIRYRFAEADAGARRVKEELTPAARRSAGGSTTTRRRRRRC